MRGGRHKPKTQVSSDGTGGRYRAEGTNLEESTDKSAKWSGKDTEESATEEEAETTGGSRGFSKIWTAKARGTQGNGEGPLPGGTEDGRGDTWDVTSAAADEAGAEGRYGAIPGVRERVVG